MKKLHQTKNWLVPHGWRKYGNQPQDGEQLKAYDNQEYDQELREEHDNQYQGEVQRVYYNNNHVDQGQGINYEDQGENGGLVIWINCIKTNLLPFKGEWNPNDFLESDLVCEWIFSVKDLTDVKKSCFVISQFDWFCIMWWE